jgi:hypothetical protein
MLQNPGSMMFAHRGVCSKSRCKPTRFMSQPSAVDRKPSLESFRVEELTCRLTPLISQPS